MAQKFSNVETYLIVIFLFAILSIGVMYLGRETINNPDSNLDNDSIAYIANLNGVDDINLNASLALYKATKSDEESSILVTDNSSQGNPKDYALDFLFAKEKGFPIEVAIKRIFNIPTFIIVDLLRFNVNDFSWLINLIGWLITLTITIAVIYFARGVPR